MKHFSNIIIGFGKAGKTLAGTLAKPYVFFKWLLSDKLFDKATMTFMHLSNKD